eukprot:6460396-Amphidinium_carterae.1
MAMAKRSSKFQDDGGRHGEKASTTKMQNRRVVEDHLCERQADWLLARGYLPPRDYGGRHWQSISGPSGPLQISHITHLHHRIQ